MVRTLAALILFAGSAALAADPAPETKALDKSIVASLRDIHDRGADLYNLSKDYPAAYRLYEGSLLTVKPLLDHRPDVQKAIADGLASAGKEPDTARKAFLLHETIEKVRSDLKGPGPKVNPVPVPTPIPVPKPKVNPVPEPKPVPKPKEPDPVPKPKEPAPKPKEPVPPVKSEATMISGIVTVQGKPLAVGTITFVSLDQKEPKVYSADVKDGAFTVKDAAPGKFAVAVTGKPAAAVPAKFATTDTSSLTFTARVGANQFDVALK